MGVTSVSDQSRRGRVRDKILARHERLDLTVREACFFESLDGYQQYLTATAAARIDLESALERSGVEEIVPVWPGYSLTPALIADLGDFNLSYGTGSAPAPMDHATVWGVVYVLAGASLGAIVLSRRAADLSLSDSYGARHLFQQVATAKTWGPFLTMFNTMALTPEQEGACVAGAHHAFAVFETAFGIDRGE